MGLGGNDFISAGGYMRCKGGAVPDPLAALSAEARRIARALNATRRASGPRREIPIRIAAEMARPRRDPSAGMQKLRRRCALTSTEPPVRRLNIPTLLRGLTSRVPESEMRKSGRANSDAGKQQGGKAVSRQCHPAAARTPCRALSSTAPDFFGAVDGVADRPADPDLDQPQRDPGRGCR